MLSWVAIGRVCRFRLITLLSPVAVVDRLMAVAAQVGCVQHLHLWWQSVPRSRSLSARVVLPGVGMLVLA
jgi:hypothetical protein